jgi:hypothetical protein
MSALMSKSILYARRALGALKSGPHGAAAVAKLRAVAPYALIELILPGGSLLALFLWLYRRQKKAAVVEAKEGKIRQLFQLWTAKSRNVNRCPELQH